MLNPKSKDWHRLEAQRQALREKLLERPLSEPEMEEFERVTKLLNEAFDAAFPTLRPRPDPWLNEP